MTLYSIAGLNQKIDLPVPLIVDLIPTTQKTQRPGIKRQLPGYWVQHETANYNAGADAAMHNRWLHQGAGGAYVSFHFVVDDGVIYQMIPIDEVTWQAADGSGPGNMSGISCELCVNQGINTAKARANAEALAGGILKALGMHADQVKRHWDFNALDPDRHHCPDQMMTSGYWPTFVSNVNAIITAGPAEDPAPPQYPMAKSLPYVPGKGWEPVDLDGNTWFPIFMQIKALKNAVPRAWASKDAPKVADTIKAGSTVMATGWVVADDGKAYFIVSGHNGRVLASSVTPNLRLSEREAAP